jgi:hypothetical protein
VNDDTRQEGRALGRSISVLAFGDNADEVELDAIDKAREFFGRHVRLEVARDYLVQQVMPGAMSVQAGGKAFQSRVTVREPS